MTSRIPAFILACLLCLLLPLNAAADVLEQVLERGSLRVGMSLFTPWAIKTPSGELVGSEVEIAHKLARDMGVKAEIREYVWEDIIAALNKGEIDVIVSGMAITPKRALKLNFSSPYAEAGVGMATNTAETSEISRLSELNGPEHTVVVVADTLAADVAKLVFDQARVVITNTSDEAEAMILAGKAHAYVASTAEARFLALEHPQKIDVPLNKPLLKSFTGMGVKKGEQELLNFLNAWVAARTADKWLATVNKYWFSTLKWRKLVPAK